MSASAASVLAAFPAKRLARAAGVHTKTAERWRAKVSEPSWDATMRMLRDDDVFAAILRAAGRADEAAKARAIAILTGEGE